MLVKARLVFTGSLTTAESANRPDRPLRRVRPLPPCGAKLRFADYGLGMVVKFQHMFDGYASQCLVQLWSAHDLPYGQTNSFVQTANSQIDMRLEYVHALCEPDHVPNRAMGSRGDEDQSPFTLILEVGILQY